MNNFTLATVVLSLFVTLILGSYWLTKKLRALGYGARLDLLHKETMNFQINVLHVISAASRPQNPQKFVLNNKKTPKK